MTGWIRPWIIAACSLWLAAAAPAGAAPADQVLQAQERLEALGLSPGPIDGVIGGQTREALRAFQRRTDLPVTGELDWQTRMALAATVRTAADGRQMPPPRAVPVPSVAISPLPPPSPEPPPDPAAAAGSDTLSAPVAWPSATLPEARDQGTVPADPPDHQLPRFVPALALALAASAAWIGLLWWAWRRRRAPARASQE